MSRSFQLEMSPAHPKLAKFRSCNDMADCCCFRQHFTLLRFYVLSSFLENFVGWQTFRHDMDE